MGDPIRILHIVVNMNRGGAETLLMNLYRNIDRTKVQFDFLTCKQGVFDDEIRALGGVIHRIPYISDAGHFGYLHALNHFFSNHKSYTIVHSHLDKMSGLVLQVAKKNNIPVRIAHSHNTRSEGKIPVKLYKWYAGKYLNPSATHFLACSNAAADWLFNKKKEVKILLNGIESHKFSFQSSVRKKVRKELGVKESTFVLGHVGRFNKQKNHQFLIDIFSQINKKHPNTELVLIGDGSLREEIESKIFKMSLQRNVKLLGSRSDVNDLLQGLDLFIFPSLHEGLPVTLVEAQASGLQCIVSDTITAEIDLGIGLVEFCSLDKELWINNIIEHINRGQSIREVSSGSLENRGYDIKTTAVETEEFYRSLIVSNS